MFQLFLTLLIQNARLFWGGRQFVLESLTWRNVMYHGARSIHLLEDAESAMLHARNTSCFRAFLHLAASPPHRLRLSAPLRHEYTLVITQFTLIFCKEHGNVLPPHVY